MKSQIRRIVLIGLGSIGKRHLESLIKLKHKYEIYLIDKNLERKIDLFKPSIVGISATTSAIGAVKQSKSFNKFTSFIKSRIGDKLVIVGGSHVSVQPETIERFDDCVDAVKVMLDDAYTRINPDFGSSGYQAQLQGVPHKLSKEQTAFKIWEECEDSGGHVNLVKFFREMEKANFDQRDSKRIFSQWETNCIIKLNDDGTYMRSRS